MKWHEGERRPELAPSCLLGDIGKSPKVPLFCKEGHGMQKIVWLGLRANTSTKCLGGTGSAKVSSGPDPAERTN